MIHILSIPNMGGRDAGLGMGADKQQGPQPHPQGDLGLGWPFRNVLN